MRYITNGRSYNVSLEPILAAIEVPVRARRAAS